jgi:hypothetical protein
MKREKLGSVFTDVAAIMVCDPCKVLRDEDGDGPDYEDYLEQSFEPSSDGSWLRGVAKPVVDIKDAHGNTGAIAVTTGSDGWCPVYLETDDDGRKRLVVELDCLCEP